MNVPALVFMGKLIAWPVGLVALCLLCKAVWARLTTTKLDHAAAAFRGYRYVFYIRRWLIVTAICLFYLTATWGR